ncbi:Bor family protein [Gammaproteobacteria bacterium]|nr:Bor family protein [Gammaproteobacteria bacterium]
MKKFNYTFILCALFMTSCATQQFISSVEGDEIQRLNKFDHFFVGGIGQEAVNDAAAICGGPDKVARVERSSTFLNWIGAFLSWSIYTPQQSRVYCKK